VTLRRLPLLLCAAGALAACKAGPHAPETASAGPAGTSASGTAGSVLPTTAEDSALVQRFIRVDSLVAQWDALQADGREEEAAAIAEKARLEVDAAYPSFVAASRGEMGLRRQYLGVQALAFATDPSATDLLVERLSGSDPRLVGNALIALKVRADPRTPLPPVLSLLGKASTEPRRFAPLALANVLAARERAGIPLETQHAQHAMTGLVGLIQDRDPYVRLHAAKAMGALRRSEAVDFLVLLLRDEHVRIRIAAAAALERIGDPRVFPQVAVLLESCEPDARVLVRDVLFSYAERIQGAPLSPAEREALGTSLPAWNRWFGDRRAATARREGP
jgi:HEAT repeat protein